MKAVRFHEHGSPSVLRYEDASEPTLGAGEVLLRVRACGTKTSGLRVESDAEFR